VAGVPLLAASNVADAITTRQLLNRGGWENNPIFGKHPSPAKQAGINLGVFGAQAGLFYVTEHNRHAWVRWTGRAFLAHSVIEHSQAAVCNAGINRTRQECRTAGHWFLRSKRDALLCSQRRAPNSHRRRRSLPMQAAPILSQEQRHTLESAYTGTGAKSRRSPGNR